MEDTYNIVKITDLSGNNRLDGRYPLRIGRVCKEPIIQNNCLYIYYLKNSDGSDYAGMVLRTSKVDGYKKQMK